jgi:hypothetical protein
VADYGNAIPRANPVVVRADRAAHESLYSQRGEEQTGNSVRRDAFRCAGLEYRIRPANRENIREDAVVPA